MLCLRTSNDRQDRHKNGGEQGYAEAALGVREDPAAVRMHLSLYRSC